jgi:hypothetical protein
MASIPRAARALMLLALVPIGQLPAQAPENSAPSASRPNPSKPSASAVPATSGGQKAPEGGTAKQGPIRLTQVPSLKGQRLSLALQMLRVSDLQGASGVFYIAPQNWRDDIEPGMVYMQTPQPGTPVPEGTVVAYWTFERAGKDQAVLSMPNLQGAPAEEAKMKLGKLGLPLTKGTIGPPAGDKAGVVDDQYPRAGQAIYKETAVFLRLRKVP